MAKPSARTLPTIGHTELEVAASGVERRGKTADQRGQNGNRECKKEDDRIQTDHRFFWNGTAWDDGYQAF